MIFLSPTVCKRGHACKILLAMLNSGLGSSRFSTQ